MIVGNSTRTKRKLITSFYLKFYNPNLTIPNDSKFFIANFFIEKQIAYLQTKNLFITTIWRKW